MRLSDAVARYGAIVGRAWPQESHWCGFAVIPSEISLVNTATGFRVARIYCNLDMVGALERALRAVVDAGKAGCLRTFDGCLNVRDVRGVPGQLSAHAYALAIDLNAATNRLGTVGDMDPVVVRCFKDQGFAWGGDFKRLDMMHYSFAWE